MTNIDLNAMTLDELKKLQKDVTKAIETYKERQRLEAIAEVEELARRKGFSLSELTQSRKSKAKRASPPKYAHPENPAATWSGRGRRPNWVNEALQSGKTLNDLLITRK